MIRASFFTKNGIFYAFEICGHSLYADAGKDIVCAAVTSAVRYAECLINDVFNADADVSIDERNAKICLSLKNGHEAASNAINALFIYFTQLKKEYPKNISVTEGLNND